MQHHGLGEYQSLKWTGRNGALEGPLAEEAPNAYLLLTRNARFNVCQNDCHRNRARLLEKIGAGEEI